MTENQGQVADNNEFLDQSGREIESDIKHLKRSTNIYTFLGTLVIILFFVVLGYKFYLKAAATNSPVFTGPDFITVGYVVVDGANILEKPSESAKKLAQLDKGESIFVLQREGDWKRVHREETKGKAATIGWIRSDWIQTRDELKAAVQDIADSPLVVDANWIVDEVENFTIIGTVNNLTDIPLRNVRLAIDFYDDNHKRLDRRIVSVSPDKPLTKDNPKSFYYTGKYKGKYTYVKYYIESFD